MSVCISRNALSLMVIYSKHIKSTLSVGTNTCEMYALLPPLSVSNIFYTGRKPVTYTMNFTVP